MPTSYHPKPAAVPARRRDLIQARSVRGFRFTESIHKGLIPSHSHQLTTINVLLRGTFEESYGLSSTSCEADSVLYRPAQEMHEDRIGQKGAHNFVIEIEDERARSISAHSRILNEVAHLRDPGLMHLVRKMRREVNAFDEASGLALEGLAMTFIAQSIRIPALPSKKVRNHQWLKRSEELLRDRFRDNGIQLSELAEEVGVHPVHFARAFKARYDTTPGCFLRSLRIKWAAEQLQTTLRPISEIALDSGFSDQSHFGRAFKKHYGVSPGVWRRSL